MYLKSSVSVKALKARVKECVVVKTTNMVRQSSEIYEKAFKKKKSSFSLFLVFFGLFLFVRAKKIFLLLLCDISHMRVFRRKSVRGMLNSSFFSTHSAQGTAVV